jgi:iron complex transport system ATP-binding protein
MERTNCLELAERPVGELSGGEQQRLLISRAIAQQSPIMLLDEPTAHLDLQHQITLLDLVRQFTRQDGMAVVLALHDLNLAARYGDRIGMIVNGCLTALDTPEKVLQADLLTKTYHIPLRVGKDELKGYPVIFAGD